MKKWIDISEMWAGIILSGKVPPEHIIADYLHPPYNHLVSMLKQGKSKAEIMAAIGPMQFNAANEASKLVDLDSNQLQDYLEALFAAHRREGQRKIMERQLKRLQDGDDLDVATMTKLLDESTSYTGKYVRLSEAEHEQITWRPTYFPPIDRNLGDPEFVEEFGVPENGLTIIAGMPGTGKTALMASLVRSMAEEMKNVLIYTLEMTTGQIAKRIIRIGTDDLTKEQKDCVLICGEKMNADEIYTDGLRLCATENIHAIFVDFADYVVDGKVDEPSMAHVYRTMADLAKYNQSGAPVFLLAQFNRTVYQGGVPQINHIRYSGFAEAAAALIFLIYNPHQIFATTGTDDRLPAMPGRAYIIVGKSRFGYKHGSVGAIDLDFDGKTSWGKEAYSWTPM